MLTNNLKLSFSYVGVVYLLLWRLGTCNVTNFYTNAGSINIHIHDWPDLTKKISCIKLRYNGFERSDWLLYFFIQSECSKPGNFHHRIGPLLTTNEWTRLYLAHSRETNKMMVMPRQVWPPISLTRFWWNFATLAKGW